MSAPRPRIAVTTGPEPIEDGGIYTRLRLDYLRAIDKAGGMPIVVSCVRAEDVSEILNLCDGLILSGGPDVAPDFFGEQPHPQLGSVVRERDDYELALAREAVTRDMPLLAICRGVQILNVALGGTLVLDIPSEVPHRVAHAHQGPRTDLAHDVRVSEGSRLHSLLGGLTKPVNSFHHQSIDRVADGLTINAVSPEDGVIEGAEMVNRKYAVGVQWHPENFWRTGEFDALFSGLVVASRKLA